MLALASAALYGAADFIGGLTSRRASAIAVVVVSQAAGLVLLLVLLAVTARSVAPAADLRWGAVAGAAGGIGVALLYRALAVGVMSLVAPVTAVCAVMIPVAADSVAGERVPMVTGAGIVLALASIVLVSQGAGVETGVGGEGGGRARGLGLAFLSGVAIGGFFLALARTDPESGLWPLAAARTTSVALFTVVALGRGLSLRLPTSVLHWAAGGGALDMAANALYLLAARRGALSVVVTLASLYPASTVLLARVALDERLSRVQGAGIVCALTAVALIVGGGD